MADHLNIVAWKTANRRDIGVDLFVHTPDRLRRMSATDGVEDGKRNTNAIFLTVCEGVRSNRTTHAKLVSTPTRLEEMDGLDVPGANWRDSTQWSLGIHHKNFDPQRCRRRS